MSYNRLLKLAQEFEDNVNNQESYVDLYFDEPLRQKIQRFV